MNVRTHIGEALDVAENKARYDANAKEILADKVIISQILKRLLPEFANVPIDEIPSYIGERSVAAVGVEPGETNAVRSTGIEYSVENEGRSTFDVFFPLRLPGVDEEVGVYVNLEAQNKERDLPYMVEQRGVFYLARLLSSQYQRDFKHSEYQKLKKVYSIWIVMDPDCKNSIASIKYNQTAIVGHPVDNKSYDLSQLFIVRLGADIDDIHEDWLLRMLTVLFSSELDVGKKKTVLDGTFGIPMTEKLEGEINAMCNLSDGIYDKGIQKGEASGIIKGRVIGMAEVGLAVEEISTRVNISVEEVKKILAEAA